MHQQSTAFPWIWIVPIVALAACAPPSGPAADEAAAGRGALCTLPAGAACASDAACCTGYCSAAGRCGLPGYPDDELTWNGPAGCPEAGIAYLVYRHCATCHHEAGMGRWFRADRFDRVFRYAKTLTSKIGTRSMPPWPPEAATDPQAQGVPADRDPIHERFALREGIFVLSGPDRARLLAWMRAAEEVKAGTRAMRDIVGPEQGEPAARDFWLAPGLYDLLAIERELAGMSCEPGGPAEQSRCTLREPQGGRLALEPILPDPARFLVGKETWWNADPNNEGSISAERGRTVHPDLLIHLTPLVDGERAANLIMPDRDPVDINRNFVAPDDCCCVVDPDSGGCREIDGVTWMSLTDARRAFAKGFGGPIDTTRVRVAEFRAGPAAHHALFYADSSEIARARQQAEQGRDLEGRYWGYAAPGAQLGFNPSGSVGAWGPGTTFPPHRLDKGLHKLFPAGADLVVQIHYAPTYLPRDEAGYPDRPMMAWYFLRNPGHTDGPPAGTHPIPYFAWTIIEDNLRIGRAASAGHHLPVSSLPTRLPADVTLMGVGPHMHERGLAVEASYREPGGAPAPFFRIWEYDGFLGEPGPGWRFGWQMSYWFEQEVAVPAGTELSLTGWFARLTDREVYFGEATRDEMVAVWVAFYVDNKPDGTRDTAAMCKLVDMPSGCAERLVSLQPVDLRTCEAP